MTVGALIAGRYRLVDRIGVGGMGAVWRAVDETNGEAPVALKRVHLDEWMSTGERERALAQLRREAEIAASVDPHENIVDVEGAVEHEGQPWLVMEFVRGRDLARVVAEDGPLVPLRAAQLGTQLAAALAHLHGAGIVHGDVTPRNVLVSDTDQVTLTDFGISRVESQQTISTRGRPAGVPAFFAPEVAGGRTASAASDVFGLGAVLHHAVVGVGPWGSGDERQVYARAVKGVVERGDQAGALAPVLRRLLERRPGDRPTAEQARELLATVAAGRRIRRRISRRTLVALGAVAAVAVITVPVVIMTSPGAPTTPAVPTAQGLGDRRTADPCALINRVELERFGDTTLETDYGNFPRCDVFIGDQPRPIQVTVQFELADPSREPVDPLETRGTTTVLREDPFDGACEREIALPDRTEISVDAKVRAGDDPNLCAVADVVTESALGVLATGSVPRRARPWDPASLADVDACALLTAADLAALPGLSNATPVADFGNWACEWDTPQGVEVTVRFNRDSDGVNGAGTPLQIAGRPAAAEVELEQACVIAVLYRPYTDQRGDSSTERVDVTVRQPAPVPDPCAAAAPVATAAANRLPAGA